MKKITILMLFSLLMNASFALTVSQRVVHTPDAVSTGTCSEVRMKVVYNTGGMINAFVTTSTVTIASGSYYDFSVTIPAGATIVSKTIEFTFSQSTNFFSFIVNGTVHDSPVQFSGCSCPLVGGATDAMYIQEIPTGRNAAVNYSIGTFLNSGC